MGANTTEGVSLGPTFVATEFVMLPEPGSADLASILAYLRLKESYPHVCRRVRTIETHMSWVFLCGAYAYKLKKPLQYGEMDARALESRHRYCLEEVRLNRRLAPTTYLGVIPMTWEKSGKLQLDGSGEVVEWLVKMRRLSSTKMLDHLIHTGNASLAIMRRLAALLADFHNACPRVMLAEDDYCTRLSKQVHLNFSELSKPEYKLPVSFLARICAAHDQALQEHAGDIAARTTGGYIVEGHGDLRAEHVYVDEPPAIIDCIEFSLALRTIDCIDEIGFLALECERLSASGLGRALVREYALAVHDMPAPTLVHLYQSIRAAIRARLAICHLQGEEVVPTSHWYRRTLDYLVLAARHLAPLHLNGFGKQL